MRLGVSHRMAYMLDLLERQQMPTLESMAIDYGMDKKSFQRTEKDLKKFFPIEKDKEGHYFFEKGFSLKKAPINEYEVALLWTALSFMYEDIETYEEDEDAFQQPSIADIKAIVIKILMQTKDNPIHIPPQNFEPIDYESRTLRTLHTSIPDLKAMEIVCESNKIVVEPYKIIAIYNMWYLLVYDREKKLIKPIRIKDIDKVNVLKESIKLPKNLDEILEDVQSAESNVQNHFNITIKAYSNIADYFIDVKRFPTQKELEEYPDGSYKLQFEVTHEEDVDNIIKSLLPDIEILEPQWYRDQVIKELELYVNKLSR